MPVPILAIVITYHPGESCLQNIMTYYDEVSEIILVDNTEHENETFLNSLNPYQKITVLKQHKNLGIGKAINFAMSKVSENSFEYILTMDQDSSFEKSEFRKYLSCLELMKIGDLGMVGVNYSGQIIGQQDDECYFQEETTLITSGSIFTRSAYREVGGFNEHLFIDGVDHEYCLRLKTKGFKVITLPGISLIHQLGTGKKVKRWGLGERVQRTIHSPIRLYYITRNYLYLNRIYKSTFPAFCASLRREILQKLKNGILYEKQKIKYIKYFFKGIRHFQQGIYGKMP